MNNEKFKELINKNEFLEYANVFNHYYGTSKEKVLKYLTNGNNILFDIDWQGTQQLKKVKNLVIGPILH